ncbi:hypothetical protein BDU57DRAFT_338398 [Ampelomyces quisqualis]|uniref:Uncharacterized protein n=1 Tax=Ampelomyces quisqualis TaxID=50730 RepID=A0A6A5QC15_AMPQU|nr:hypothetical protein BDU57DRAFT_338398 [Ampelomyces quisqualis]
MQRPFWGVGAWRDTQRGCSAAMDWRCCWSCRQVAGHADGDGMGWDGMGWDGVRCMRWDGVRCMRWDGTRCAGDGDAYGGCRPASYLHRHPRPAATLRRHGLKLQPAATAFWLSSPRSGDWRPRPSHRGGQWQRARASMGKSTWRPTTSRPEPPKPGGAARALCRFAVLPQCPSLPCAVRGTTVYSLLLRTDTRPRVLPNHCCCVALSWQ